MEIERKTLGAVPDDHAAVGFRGHRIPIPPALRPQHALLTAREQPRTPMRRRGSFILDASSF